MGFISGDLEIDLCVCCSFWFMSSCFKGATDLKFEQNNGGARGSTLFTPGGEITCCHLGALLVQIFSERVSASV